VAQGFATENFQTMSNTNVVRQKGRTLYQFETAVDTVGIMSPTKQGKNVNFNADAMRSILKDGWAVKELHNRRLQRGLSDERLFGSAKQKVTKAPEQLPLILS
jgi:hypothetical protein